MLRTLSASAVVSLLGLGAACGAGDVSPPPLLATDGGTTVTDTGTTTDTGPVEAAPGKVLQTGKIVALSLKTAVAGATVTAGVGGPSATTDARGGYSLSVDPTKPFSLMVSATDAYTLTEQETLVKGAIDLGKTNLLLQSTADILLATLNNHDESLGVLSVGVEKQGACASEAGATFEYTVDGQPPVAPATLYYFSGNIPSQSATKTEEQTIDNPAYAVIYNLPPGKPVSVTVKHPTCTMAPYPVVKDLTGTGQGTGEITYVSGTLATLGGKNTAFVRVFLK